MKEFTDKVSFLNKQTKSNISRFFLVSQPKFFRSFVSIRNKFLQKLLNFPVGELILLDSDDTFNIRALFESLKNDGLIYHYGEGAIFSDYPKFNYVGIFYYLDRENLKDVQNAWGYCLLDDGRELAFSKVLGECLERQSSYFDPKIKNVFFPKVYLGDATFIYEHIPKFTSIQLETNKKLVSTKQDLKNTLGFKAKSLTGDKSRFLPFEAFYWGREVENEQKLIQHATTSGGGGGSTYKKAVLSAMYELIERDHLLLYWLSGVHPQIINNESISGSFGDYLKECKDTYSLEVYLLDLRYDFELLTCACIIIDPVLSLITIGAKTGQDGEEVLKGAFLEALAVLSASRDNKSRNDSKDFSDNLLDKIIKSKPFTSDLTRRQRINLYASEIGIKTVRSIFLQGKSIEYLDFVGSITRKSSQTEELDYVIEEFKRIIRKKGDGYEAYVHQFQSKWTKKLNYQVVHVFVPALMKLYLNEALATPVSDRLNEFASEHGKSISRESDLNGIPHFFP